MRYLIQPPVVLLAFLVCGPAQAVDWLTLPSTYSHGPDGGRVAQYAPVEAPSVPIDSSFRTSGYTHTRSTLNYGQSSDNYHRVEQWGDSVRPYGEWRFPFRPYSTPYPNWGAPFAGLQPNLPFPNAGGFGRGLGRGGFGRGGFGRGGFGRRPGGPVYDDPNSGDPPTENPDNPNPTRQPIPRFRGETGYLGGGRWPADRNRSFPTPQGPLNPYPSGPGTPYPVAPYYDGYYPPYSD